MLKIKHIKLLLFLSLYKSSRGDVEIGKYLQICDRNSPDVNDCLVDAIQDGITRLSDGLPELDVPPIDPYVQKEIRVEYKNNQVVAKMIMKNIVVTGLKEAKVHDVRLKADEDRFYMEVDITSPRVHVTGQYHGEGQYTSLNIKTDGEFNTTMTDLVYTWKLEGKPEVKNGTTYIKIDSFYMRPDVGGFKSYISNVVPDNPELTNVANEFANRNWRILYREMLPYAQANWNKIGTRVANKIFLKIPYDQLFPAKNLTN